MLKKLIKKKLQSLDYPKKYADELEYQLITSKNWFSVIENLSNDKIIDNFIYFIAIENENNWSI